MAEAIDLSWKSGFQADVDVGPLLRLLWEVRCGDFIKTRTGEGYAHYALYPESYLEAARTSGLTANTFVIGIRSIGVGLGALIAAALGAPPAISLRPVGHPFDREIRAAPGLVEAKAANPEVHFAIADEGPGLSGSSFASVARWLQRHGVATNRIHFFPSHAGQPGSSAAWKIRVIWNGVQRHPACPDQFIAQANGLRSWVEKKIGKVEFLQEISSTISRTKTCPPPHDARFARRKLIARNADGLWLVKFAGIGEIGERKFRDATALASAGFGPEVAALCHGFLVQKWVEGRPLNEFAYDRKKFVMVLGSYLAFRARHLGPPGAGASVEALRSMAIHNTSRSLGAEAASALEWRLAASASLHDRVHRVRTDNRLHAWEWLATERGILKIDAVDHCEAHDLIGCQDIAWDIAGSIVEYGLVDNEITDLCRMVRATGGPEIDGEMIAAFLPCYLAFQVGLWSTAAPSCFETAAMANLYADKLSRYLRQQSLTEPCRRADITAS
jgi:hypothetical protein